MHEHIGHSIVPFPLDLNSESLTKAEFLDFLQNQNNKSPTTLDMIAVTLIHTLIRQEKISLRVEPMKRVLHVFYLP